MGNKDYDPGVWHFAYCAKVQISKDELCTCDGVHACCGCSCHVCAQGHNTGSHTDACKRRIDAHMGQENNPVTDRPIAEIEAIIRRLKWVVPGRDYPRLLVEEPIYVWPGIHDRLSLYERND